MIFVTDYSPEGSSLRACLQSESIVFRSICFQNKSPKKQQKKTMLPWWPSKATGQPLQLSACGVQYGRNRQLQSFHHEGCQVPLCLERDHLMKRDQQNQSLDELSSNSSSDG